MKSNVLINRGLGLLALVIASDTFAHPLHWSTDTVGFVSGLLHPLTGIDHVLAMLAIGIWVYQQTHFNRLFLSLGLIGCLLTGSGLSLIPMEIAYSELLLYAVTLTFGLLLASDQPIPGWLSWGSVCLFALMHGYVHALDIWLDNDVWPYTAGFSLSSLLMVFIGFWLRQSIPVFLQKRIEENSSGGH